MSTQVFIHRREGKPIKLNCTCDVGSTGQKDQRKASMVSEVCKERRGIHQPEGRPQKEKQCKDQYMVSKANKVSKESGGMHP